MQSSLKDEVLPMALKLVHARMSCLTHVDDGAVGSCVGAREIETSVESVFPIGATNI